MARWDRQTGETPVAYRAFCVYRDLGIGRSINRALDTHREAGGRGSRSRWSDWSARNEWVARATAYDRYVETEARRQREKDIRAMVERHIGAARGMFAVGLTAMNKKKPEELTPKDAMQFVAEGIRLERQAMGEPGETVEVELTSLSNQQKAAKVRRKLERLVGLKVPDDSSDNAAE